MGKKSAHTQFPINEMCPLLESAKYFVTVCKTANATAKRWLASEGLTKNGKAIISSDRHANRFLPASLQPIDCLLLFFFGADKFTCRRACAAYGGMECAYSVAREPHVTITTTAK